MKKLIVQILINSLLILVMLVGFLGITPEQVQAATSLTVTPITWNVIGLDSNNVNVGPNTFPVGIRVCNIGSSASASLTAEFVWDSSNPYINLSGGNTPTLTHPGLAVGACTDFYYEVEVTRNTSAYNTTRRYYITVTEAGNPITFSTPRPRELYVEKLISQARNDQFNLELSVDGTSFTPFAAGQTLTLLKGQTYFLRLSAYTATNGYEQIESYLNLPNLYFRVLSVRTDYTAGTDSNKLYGDGCTWENDPNSPNYRSCLSTGKNGGDVITTYEVYIVDYRSGDPTPVNGMIYDFSGSSYHYNSDYIGDARDLYNLDPVQVPFTKTFVPDAITPGGVSQATFKITNPSSLVLTNVNFTDALPGDMAIAATPGLSYTGCGTSPSSTGITQGSQAISFSNITLAPYALCVIKVNVTATAQTTLTNTTSPLTFSIGTGTYTGTTATDDLTIAAYVRSCTAGATLANWTVPTGAVSPPDTLGGVPSTIGPQVSTATATGVGTTSEAFAIDATSFPGNSVWEMTGKLGGTARDPAKYFQFTVDTTLYENVVWSFALAELKNGPTSFDISYIPAGGTETPLTSVTGVTGTLQTVTRTIGTGYLPGGNTVFRIYPYNASNSGKDAVAVLDAIQFTGDYCAPPPPAITKSFSPDSIWVGATSQLTFNITNTSTNPGSGPLTGITFTDTLPTGFSIAAGAQTNTCGGTITAVSGSSTISLSGVSMAAGASCAITIPVIGTIAGSFTNISGRISAAGTGENKSASGFAIDDITVIGPPTITKDFTAETILTGQSTPLTFTITNPNPTTTLTGITFTDALPAGLTVLSSSSPQCSGTLTTTAPANIQLGAVTLAPYGSCTFSVAVTGAVSSGTTFYTNTTSTVTTNESAPGGPATDTLYVRNPMPGLSLLKQVSTSATGPWYHYLVVEAGTPVYYRFTVENTGDVDLTNVEVTDPEMSPSSVCTIATLEYASSPESEPTAICSSGPITAVDGGNINTASASGYSNFTQVFAPNSSAEYDTPELLLEKTSAEAYYTAAGQVLHYTYVVTNHGAILPEPVSITDDKATVSCPSLTTIDDFDDWFDTGESLTCTATYTTTGEDTTVVNVATALVDGYPSNEDEASVPKLPANFGHLPSSYTNMNLFADNGARHITNSTATGTYLGASVPVELDGINNLTYSGQATDNGVFFKGTWTVLGGGLLSITPHCPDGLTCYVNGWIDWNQNEFFDSGEWTVQNISFTGTTPSDVPLVIPEGTNLGDGQVFYTRFRIYSAFPGAAPLSYGQAPDTDTSGSGEVEDYEITMRGGTPYTTPVTLSFFSTSRSGDNVTFTWSTATETGNAGFNLYVGNDRVRTLVNPELIKSKVIDSLAPQEYTYTAAVDGNTFFIEDVSVTGEFRVHGPFQLGKAYGEKTKNEIIDWSTIQKENRNKQTTRQKNLANGLTVNSSGNTLNFKVSKTGIYRVTYEMLKTAGYDLEGIQTAKISLASAGKAVPIYIYGKSTFGPGSYIEFYGQALDTLYTDTNIFTLQTNAAKPPRVTVDTKQVSRTTSYASSYIETLKVNNQKQYSQNAPGVDPWYETSLVVYTTPKYWNFPITINGLANTTTVTNLTLTMWGGTEWPQNPDHHLQVSVNGVQVADVFFDGLVEKTLNLSIPAGVLVEGTNTLRLTLPGDTGTKNEMQRLDKFSITYPRTFRATDGQITFTASGSGFKVTNLPGKDIVVYRIEPNGLQTRLNPDVSTASDSTFTAAFPGTTTNSTYLVTTNTTLLAPTYEATRANVDLNKPAEFLIIAHPDFIPDLQPFISARQSNYTVSVVDVTDLYSNYTYGVFDPAAIQQYIQYAARNLGTKYVLLVGGDTFDYRNYSKLNSVSFIPSLYAATGSIVTYAPVDPLFADIDGDNIPDLAIGRFPVRSTSELKLIIQKTLQYHIKDYGRTAVFASDKFDHGYSFQQISESMSGKLPANWSVESISLENLDLTTTRTRLLAAMNNGTALVNYTGHSGPGDWTFSGLFNQADVAKLTNASRPFVVVQWGCWNNYYVYPNYNFLVQSFLFAGDKGAAAVLGATTLSDISSEQLLGELLVPKLATQGMTIGQAVQDAKRQLANDHPEMLDVLLGWSLMGDPTLVIEP